MQRFSNGLFLHTRIKHDIFVHNIIIMNSSGLKLLLTVCITVASFKCMSQVTNIEYMLESSLIGFSSVKVYQNDSGSPVPLQNQNTSECGYVDMGLSVKWATCNLGASKPEEYGGYYAWGETEPKAYYSWNTYRYCNYDSVRYDLFIFKYLLDTEFHLGDKRILLEPEDDAANILLGGAWRIPTRDEFQELQDACNCIWRWTDDYNGTGVSGCIVTSKKTGYEGNSIFLPMAGMRFMNNWNDAGARGRYWSSSVGLKSDRDACGMTIDSENCIISDIDRFFGYTIRPVCE